MCELEKGTITTALSLEEIAESVKGLGGHSHGQSEYCIPIPSGLSLAQILGIKKGGVFFYASQLVKNWRGLPDLIKAVVERYQGVAFVNYNSKTGILSIEGDVVAVAGESHEVRSLFCDWEQTRGQKRFLRSLPAKLSAVIAEAEAYKQESNTPCYVPEAQEVLRSLLLTTT